MTRAEAKRLAELRLEELFEQVPYGDLLAAGGKETCQARDGKPYTVHIQTWIEDGRTGQVRAMVSVDGGGWSAWFPASRDDLVTPPAGDGRMKR